MNFFTSRLFYILMALWSLFGIIYPPFDLISALNIVAFVYWANCLYNHKDAVAK